MHGFAMWAQPVQIQSSPLAFGREDRRTLACHNPSRPGGFGQGVPES
jgi:hypothetical protein